MEKPTRISYKDLFIAMRICSTSSWEDAVKPPSIVEKIKYLLISSLSKRQAKAFETFGRYMSESMSAPKLWMKDEDKSNVTKEKIPRTLSIVCVLMTKFGMSEKEAWNMPFAKAIWYSTAYAAQEGAEVEVITTEQEEKENTDLSRLEKFEKAMANSVSKKNRKVNVI